MPPRDPALKPYRVSLYVVYGLFATLLFVQLVRSVASDLYGHTPPAGPPKTPHACLDEVDRLYGQLSARAVQAAPGGLEGGALSREWDAWTRRWEEDVAQVSDRCGLSDPKDDAGRALAQAVDGLEALRRELSRSGEDAASEARHVQDALATAREPLRAK
ncbi:MAG: hypothetical protein ACJ79T_18650 [Myxococcales bacterium]